MAARTKPPRKVRVGCLTYEVIPAHDRVREHDAAALHLSTSAEILYDDRLGVDNERLNVFHEIHHACVHLAGIEFDDDDEEKLVRAIAPVMLDTLKRNPRLVAYLLGP